MLETRDSVGDSTTGWRESKVVVRQVGQGREQVARSAKKRRRVSVGGHAGEGYIYMGHRKPLCMAFGSQEAAVAVEGDAVPGR